MKRKIVLSNVIIVASALILLFASGIVITKQTYKEQAEDKIKEIASVYAQNFTSADLAVKNPPDNIRVTVIAKDGAVIADSLAENVSNMENHLERSEIIAAEKGEIIAVTRHSATLNRDFSYSAVKISYGDDYLFVRVSTPVESVNVYAKKTIFSTVVVMIGAIIIAFIISVLLSKNLLKPMRDVKNGLEAINKGTYKPVSPTTKDNDVNEMISEINDISEKLSQTLIAVNEDNKRLDYILNNVSDGIIVLKSDGNIEVLNDKARKIFGVKNPVSSSFCVLTEDKTFLSSITSAIHDGVNSVFEYSALTGEIFFTSVRRLESGLIIILLSDITPVKEGENMRSEFFANASHELKTPLTAIKGFNDLIGLKTASQEISSLSNKIDKQVVRVVSLIDDMLNLSKLENTKLPQKEKVDLNALCLDVKESLTSLISLKDVSVEITGEGVVFMEKDHAFELVKNLMENAVRYNNDGGHVFVTLSKGANEVVLKVKDDGIGIGEEDQARIFERFYRVDKSRSRETGGTGLGLSIVKHVAELYNAKLTLLSTLGVGTEIVVAVPTEN